MSGVAWHDPAVRRAVTDLVREVEAASAVELVVTVRPRSGDYRHADLAFGALVAFVALAVYVYAPQEFTDDLVPPVLAALFGASAFFAAHVAPVRRLFTSKAARAEAVRVAARAAFVDQRVSATRDRTGVLVYVSLFERRAEIVADLGVLRRAAGGEPDAVFAAIARVVAEQRGLADLEAAVRAFGAWAAVALPARDDDQNELDDAPRIT